MDIYSKDEVGHFVSRLNEFYCASMTEAGLSDEQVLDVIGRVSDKLTVDLLTQDFGQTPSPTDN